MNDISTGSSSRVPTVILVILAIVGVALGGAGLYASVTSREAVDAIGVKMDNELSDASDLSSGVRELDTRARSTFGAINAEIASLREQLSNTVAKAAAPVKGEGAKKGEKVAQPLDPNGTYHTIRPGDFLGRVAKQYGTTVAAIEALNPGLDSRHMRLGQKIRVR